ncbi:MAG: hypothetical protein QXS81_04735 [Candidatus Micrarchaeaceae archaeon]
MLKLYKCKRCNYEWASRREKEPKECPRCKTRYWNVDRVYKPYNWYKAHRMKEKVYA